MVLSGCSDLGFFLAVSTVTFLKCHVQTLLLSKQFVQWNEILTHLEAAKQAKPVAE